MIFTISNNTYQIWLPIFTLNDVAYNQKFYQFLLIFELLLSLTVLVFTITSGFIILTRTAFHKNFNSLIAIVVLSWLFSAAGKLLLTPYFIGFWVIEPVTRGLPWWTCDVAKMARLDSISSAWPLFLGGALTWYYMSILTTCLITLSIERVCASFFIKNYENTRRTYLLALLILFQQILIFLLGYFLFFNLIHFITIVSVLVGLNVLAMMVFCINRWYNLKVLREFEQRPRESAKHYTLPVRFQAKENLRVFNLTARVFVVGFFLIILGFTFCVMITFEWAPSLETLLIFCFENLIHLNPLIINAVLILSVSTWSKALPNSRLFRKISLIKVHPIVPNHSQQQETDTYFSQLHSVWEKKVNVL